MISKPTIARITDAARIEEVVGDFLSLKKRGVNYIACCPFHNEKTPSFNVNPVRNIYKCFGCGKGGDAVSFVMEHEKMSYPESLRYLAKKYNIEIEELYDKNAEEEKKLETERESLFVVNTFGQKYFSNTLYNSDEGKSIGLSYFKERGLSDDIIQRFQLGYAPEGRTVFTEAARKEGYNPDYLIKTGLTIRPEDHLDNYYDRFAGRVMFPIQNITGRVIGFGGRALRKDVKAKYVNSPESEIYHKSNVLYGMNLARKTISQEDNCFLVEGYMDVISMHQAGIENTVASSGTSLTVEQIKLIKRYTSNITIMYDGDSAGIKASFRGIDMILEEGLNVRVVLFPEGNDPDSYARNHSESEFKKFIHGNTTDFIRFKTQLLYKETDNDPIKKATLIQQIVESIALIPNSITRTVFIQECSKIMKMEEQALLTELNKALRKQYSKRTNEPHLEEVIDLDSTSFPQPTDLDPYSCEEQEKEIIRMLLTYGDRTIELEETEMDENGNVTQVKYNMSITEFIINHIMIDKDTIDFSNELYKKIFNPITEHFGKGEIITSNFFIQNEDTKLSAVAVDLTTPRYTLSNWEKQLGSPVGSEIDNLKKTVQDVIYSFKQQKVGKIKSEVQNRIKQAEVEGNEEVVTLLQSQAIILDKTEKAFSKELGRVIIR